MMGRKKDETCEIDSLFSTPKTSKSLKTSKKLIFIKKPRTTVGLTFSTPTPTNSDIIDCNESNVRQIYATNSLGDDKTGAGRDDLAKNRINKRKMFPDAPNNNTPIVRKKPKISAIFNTESSTQIETFSGIGSTSTFLSNFEAASNNLLISPLSEASKPIVRYCQRKKEKISRGIQTENIKNNKKCRNMHIQTDREIEVVDEVSEKAKNIGERIMKISKRSFKPAKGKHFKNKYDSGWMYDNPTRYMIARMADMSQPRSGPSANYKNKGRRAIVMAIMTKIGLVPGSARIIISGKEEAKLIDYHEDLDTNSSILLDNASKFIAEPMKSCPQATVQSRILSIISMEKYMLKCR
ncbi:unnamed protein product [Caenorhabditis angaria]|uniref:Uncharacterized protein n=1 Tax=Caenorhabditis angaria TaxID=860376 RepID=A0A9P1IA65_9PELO|nr:unnamed protein product [Caenorhabditis angaria]